jgi:hypothetical protein
MAECDCEPPAAPPSETEMHEILLGYLEGVRDDGLNVEMAADFITRLFNLRDYLRERERANATVDGSPEDAIYDTEQPIDVSCGAFIEVVRFN